MQSDEETWRNRGERRAKSRLKGVAPGIAFFFCKRRSSGSVGSIERRKLIFLFILDIHSVFSFCISYLNKSLKVID